MIEKFLECEDLTVLMSSDGTTFKSMSLAQDNTRILDGDTGSNT